VFNKKVYVYQCTNCFNTERNIYERRIDLSDEDVNKCAKCRVPGTLVFFEERTDYPMY